MSAPDAGTEHPQRNWRRWRIPTKIYGRVRTSTVAFGICFVLTGLLYGQLSEEKAEINRQSVQGPVAVSPDEFTQPDESQTYVPTPSRSSTTTTPSATTEPESSTSAEDTGTQSATTVPPTTTTAPFGVPIPPAIQSLIPSRPAPTSSR
ncbi:hypothetical protein HQO27_12950 [Rhodococcus fascians]|nr:hypothetical protein [Rhodococcus fascians]MBY4236722.1 hypothetical protein [Rhodococcus fascians]MBY4251912.1 hypothetical protein [Rhodococcus fascians]MBY4268066.1 hypothetical protein [Rhodococcus fascians]MBY4274054.1 hypothetical protein [Rhodococcus fascians]